MDNVNNASWGSFLENASQPANEQPVTESETDGAETEFEESADFDANESESDDEQAETHSDDDQSDGAEDPDISLGEGKNAVKLSELKDGYLRQADYTRKTNELAAQRKELESQRESLTDAQGFKDHMEANPWLWDQVNRVLQDFETTGYLALDEVMQDAQYGKHVNHLMSENARLEKALADSSNELGGIKLQSSIQSLKTSLTADYGGLVTDEYMSTLQERMKSENLPMETIREIAEGQLAKKSLGMNKKDLKAATKKAEADTLQKIAETKRTAPKSATQTNARPASPPKDSPKGWGDWFRAREPQ